MEANFHQKNDRGFISDDELDLIKRSQNRDKLAFSELVTQHQQWLYAIAVSHLRNFRDAEDVVQESLLHAWQKLPQLRDRKKFRHWLAKIVLNQCSNFRRGKQRTMIPLTDLGEQEKAYFENKIAELAQSSQLNQEMRETIELYLDNIPKKYRTVLYLKYVSNCSLDEISGILQISRRNAAARIHAAKRLLRKKIAVNQINNKNQDRLSD
ncbi:MAG: RNA polymerase sigma factor [bacterium]